MQILSTARQPVDKILLGITITLVALGAVVFISASLSVLAENKALFYRALVNQLILGVGFGGVALWLCSRISYSVWRKYATGLFIISIILTLLVFIPGIGLEHNGATRWISLGIISFQPAELLKVAFIMYLAAWLSGNRKRLEKFQSSVIPLLVFLGVTGIILLLQPDTGTLLVILGAALAMYFVAGAKWKHLGIILVFFLVAFSGLVIARPYLLDRLMTFSDPSRDPLGSSYQIQQSLIAIGSGQITGRGLGHSVQKFSYLPEPTGDSIFAIIGEEFGFVGSLILITLYLAFAFRGLRIGLRAPDLFGQLLVFGIVILITAQSFLNIGATVGIFPLTGLPLIFISHGGTALLIALASVGMILNVSRYKGKTQ